MPPVRRTTEPLPQYWTQTNPQPPGRRRRRPTSRPEPPRGPRPWLWALAGFAVAAVIGLVAWLVFVDTSPSKQDTSIAALVADAHPRRPSRELRRPHDRRASPLPIPLPSLTLPIRDPSSSSNAPGETEPVTYEVTGTGMAITITYNDTGGVMQNEFGVSLPWHKEVEPAQARPRSRRASS